MRLNENRIGGGYEPPLTPKDKEILKNIGLAILAVLGVLVYLIYKLIGN